MPQKIYSDLLSGIFEKVGVSKPEEQAQYVERLREPARSLKFGYNNAAVSGSYKADDVQAAYLLRYLLPYSRFLPKILAALKQRKKIDASGALSIAFVCTGPSPETIGLGRFLAAEGHADIPHKICLIDRNKTEWQFARSIVFNSLIPTIKELRKTTVSEVSMDLQKDPPINQTWDLIVFQNCLNEIAGPGLFDMNKLAAWAATLKKGGLLVLLDRTKYPVIDKFMLDAATHLPAVGCDLILSATDTISVHDINGAMPPAIGGKLFYYANGWINLDQRNNGLILTNNWEYLVSVYAKR